jgi:hypothetical protein
VSTPYYVSLLPFCLSYSNEVPGIPLVDERTHHAQTADDHRFKPGHPLLPSVNDGHTHSAFCPCLTGLGEQPRPLVLEIPFPVVRRIDPPIP